MGYGISRRIPGAIPIGDDSGGKVLLYMEGAKGKGLYRVGFGDLDRDDAQWLSATLDSFLVDGIGLESFKG